MDSLAGSGLYASRGALHVHTDPEYPGVYPYADRLTAGAYGLACLGKSNVFTQSYEFRDIRCTSLDILSDRGAKVDVKRFDDAACDEALRKLRVYSYRYEHDRTDRQHIGMMAQEVHAQLPGTMHSETTIDYVALINHILCQTQRLAQRLESVEAILSSKVAPSVSDKAVTER